MSDENSQAAAPLSPDVNAEMKVRKAHSTENGLTNILGDLMCDECEDVYPCAEIRALDHLWKIVHLYADYVRFLNEANEAPVGMAYVHGWRCPQSDIDRGQEFRSQIAEALTE